ncbi:methylated-DNA--[protein]-cysteine S-methyltransferase [Blastopirellula sp. J2-11]|uniref:methylated-DNA--[protein]-cysteine S-methyltransferase n=1 Tax=Blastopirellula sp. J2-11 TaxID=2943192 RepID=UPI0021C60933|nr:methylated-DNA--[protein]-cysteine S-methyltransferase [Blastopirellula sp. J2-11]UUO09153.1 methylated-DNA--[protein]-cysteine S-methyltransferase [Blastopirellula sp. J2-11]
MPFSISHQDSPLGSLRIVTDEQENLRALDFHDYESRLHTLLTRHYGAYELKEASTPAKIRNALTHYFAGDLLAIEDLSICTGGTPFQCAIWQALRSIPASVTMSYGELARQVGKPNASRAVGLANGANPIAIVVPCHRIIGASGALTGYGGGLPRKRWLLDHEQKHAAICTT